MLAACGSVAKHDDAEAAVDLEDTMMEVVHPSYGVAVDLALLVVGLDVMAWGASYADVYYCDTG